MPQSNNCKSSIQQKIGSIKTNAVSRRTPSPFPAVINMYNNMYAKQQKQLPVILVTIVTLTTSF